MTDLKWLGDIAIARLHNCIRGAGWSGVDTSLSSRRRQMNRTNCNSRALARKASCAESAATQGAIRAGRVPVSEICLVVASLACSSGFARGQVE